jgi:hypothetical protein
MAMDYTAFDQVSNHLVLTPFAVGPRAWVVDFVALECLAEAFVRNEV